MGHAHGLDSSHVDLSRLIGIMAVRNGERSKNPRRHGPAGTDPEPAPYRRWTGEERARLRSLVETRTLHQAAGIFGVDIRWVMRRINRKTLRAVTPYGRRPGLRQVGLYRVPAQAVRSYLMSHADELQGRGVDLARIAGIMAGVRDPGHVKGRHPGSPGFPAAGFRAPEIGPGSGPKTLSQKAPGNGPGDCRFPRRGGTVQYPPFPSTTDVGFITGGLQPCSGPAGLGGVPRSTDVKVANLFGSAFLDSGALPICVYRFSGVSIRLGAWGVVVKGIEYESLISDVDHVTGAFRAPIPVSLVSGLPHWACTLRPPAAPISAPPGTVSGGAGSEILEFAIVNDGLDLRHRRSRPPPAPPMGAAPGHAQPRPSGPPGTS